MFPQLVPRAVCLVALTTPEGSGHTDLGRPGAVPRNPTMLIPRFSIRLLLVVTAACSLLGPVLAAAARGRAWALGIVIGLVTAAAFLVVHALLFAAVSLIGRSGRALRRSSR